MARLFASASSQFLEASSAARAIKPLSLACWFKPTTTTNAQVLVSLDSASTGNRHFAIGMAAGGAVQVIERGSVASLSATIPTLTAGTWGHAACTFATGATGTRTPYLNGAAGTTNATNVSTAPVPERTTLGAFILTAPSTYSSFTDGSLAEVGIWNVVLTADDIAMLAHGIRPSQVRPSALVFYAPLISGASPEPDIRASLSLALTGTLTQDSHPPILGQAGKLWVPPIAVSSKPLAGTIAATSSLAGSLSVTDALAGTIASSAACAGSLGVGATLAGVTAATSTFAGGLTTRAVCTGTIAGTATLSGDAAPQIHLSGTVTATATLAGTLTPPGHRDTVRLEITDGPVSNLTLQETRVTAETSDDRDSVGITTLE